jgi:AcrR family transcriptional regulator
VTDDQGAQEEREDGRRRRLAPEARRTELLNAALEAFGELGFGRASLQDVADRAGVTKGAIYHYFDSKEQLLIELLRERLLPAIETDEELIRAAAGSRDEVLRTMLVRMWRRFQEPGQTELARLAITELPKYPELGQILYREIAQRGREVLRRALEWGIERGELCAGAAEEVVAVLPYMVMGVALGQHIFRGIDGVDLSAEQGERVITTLLLRGVGRTCAR